jgi:hypothetical protein
LCIKFNMCKTLAKDFLRLSIELLNIYSVSKHSSISKLNIFNVLFLKGFFLVLGGCKQVFLYHLFNGVFSLCLIKLILKFDLIDYGFE